MTVVEPQRHLYGHVDDASPEAVRASGSTVVYVQGGIHSGEAEGKEVLLMLLRDIADGRHAEWLDSLVLLVAPLYNADGNERVTLTNRRGQHGPIGGMGQRPNAQGYDLNRDHMKLDSPEARSLAMLFTRYDPQVAMAVIVENAGHGSREAAPVAGRWLRAYFAEGDSLPDLPVPVTVNGR